MSSSRLPLRFGTPRNSCPWTPPWATSCICWPATTPARVACKCCFMSPLSCSSWPGCAGAQRAPTKPPERITMKLNAAFLAAMGMLCLQAAHAGPADYVYTPTVEAGEKEIDFKFGTEDSDPRKTVGTIGLGYGANDWW